MSLKIDVNVRRSAQRAGVRPLSEQPLYRHLMFFGHVTLLPEGDPRQRNIFVGGSLNLELERCVRRVGQPRLTRKSEVFKAGMQKLGQGRLHALLMDSTYNALAKWKAALNECFAPNN